MDFGNNNRLIWSKRVRGLAAQEKRKEKKEKTSLFASFNCCGQSYVGLKQLDQAKLQLMRLSSIKSFVTNNLD